MNKLIVFILLFLASPIYGQEVYLRNVVDIQSTFHVKGVSVTGEPIQVPIVNGLVPDLVEGTRQDGSKYYIFDYRNRRQYNEYQGCIINYDPNFKAKQAKQEETVKTYPPPIRIQNDGVLKLKKPSEVGGAAQNSILPKYPKE